MEGYMLPCLNKQLFGVECLGCGIQRSIALIFKGEFVEAFYMYPAIYNIFILLIFLIFNLFIKFKHDYKIKMGLIFLTVLIVVVSYLIKITH
ncbi:hypothetical protein BWZ22_12470 [Seonamhaeicola sp. S2-3]|uniref:DUF2752 domain-containing protein n=1 Tax=Seonamhaeicola sp. S2-3 TaxID=1936081 RepID=UPI000972AD92|nr:DUF2752 domain-containing protein [Seonamhaeicola sp. S2-3]APY11994.1 hypothetical protein BWZ22_12470 [Seonamhaeicola sp. S2-3]